MVLVEWVFHDGVICLVVCVVLGIYRVVVALVVVVVVEVAKVLVSCPRRRPCQLLVELVVPLVVALERHDADVSPLCIVLVYRNKLNPISIVPQITKCLLGIQTSVAHMLKH